MECSHGSLTRACGVCERDERIARMTAALEVTAGNIRSLGPAHALEQVPMAYREWLRVVDEALLP